MEYVVLLILLLIVHPYLTYPLSLFLCNKIRGYGPNGASSFNLTEECPFVSILIAAYNEEKVIGEKIENSLSLLYPQEKLEIVIGSDGSQDNTNSIVNSYVDKYKNIKLLPYQERMGKANIINESIKHCQGEIILLSDASALYNQEALQNILVHFHDPQVGCVAGRVVRTADDRIGENEGLYWKLQSFIKREESNLDTVMGADGALYAIRKRLFTPLPQDTSVDDFLLSMFIVKQGYKIKYEPQAYSCGPSGQSLSIEFQRKVRIAAGNYYNLKYLTSFMKLDRHSYMFISHKLLRWISPFLFIALTISLLMIYKEKAIYSFVLLYLLGSYALAVCGYYGGNELLKRSKIISLATHFYVAVFAQLWGFIKYINKSQAAFWDTARK